jgi:hypothetical protein
MDKIQNTTRNSLCGGTGSKRKQAGWAEPSFLIIPKALPPPTTVGDD